MSFDLPKGKAIETLRKAALQGEIQILFSDAVVEGVMTQRIRGRYTPREALDLMLGGTGLGIAQANTNGAYAITTAENRTKSSNGNDTAPENQTYYETKIETKMKSKKNNWLKALAAALALGIPGEQDGLRAQGAKSETTGNVYELSPFEVTTQNTGYLSTTSTIATRTNRATIEIPQTINLITSELLEDTAAFKQEEAIQYVPNVFPRNTFGQPQAFLIRGYEREGAIYVDGFTSGSYSRDTAGYQMLEVIKGPPSAVQGRAGASGALNWVSKKPIHGTEFFNSKITFGTDDSFENIFRAEFDGNMTVVRDGDKDILSVRGVAVVQSGDSWTQFLPDEKYAFYPSMRWQIGDKTELTAFGEFLKLRQPSANIASGPAFFSKGFRDKFDDPLLGGDPNDPISALNIPYGTNMIGPGRVQKGDITAGTFSLTHEFNDNVNFRQGYQFISTSESRVTGEPGARLDRVNDSYLGVSGLWVSNAFNPDESSDDRHTFQGDLHLDYELSDWFRSTTLIGYEWWQNDSVNSSENVTLAEEFRQVNLANISNDSSFWNGQIESRTFRDRDVGDTDNFSYYLQQEFGLWDRFITTAAWRNDDRNSNNIDDDGTVTTTDDTTDSLRFGLTAFLNDSKTLSAYVVRSDQEDPTRQRNEWSPGLAPSDPRIDNRLVYNPGMELFEIGLKSEFFNRGLSVTAAYFEQDLTNNLNTVGELTETPPGSGNFQVVTHGSLADSTSKGIEIEAVGSIGDRFKFIASYATLDTEEVRVIAGALGTRRIHRATDWNFNVFGKYDMRDTQGNGFQLRGGIHSYADFVGTFSGVRTFIDETFVSLDMGVSYQYGKHTYDLLVKNATDEEIFIMRGLPLRQYRFSVNSRW